MNLFDPRRVYQFFKDRYVLGKKSPAGWYSFDCPFCGKAKKCAVHFINSWVKCWSCSASSWIVEFVQETESVDYITAKEMLWNVTPSGLDLEVLEDIAYEKEIVSDVILPAGWTSLLDGKGILGVRARNYLEKRGFDLELLEMQGFGYCNKHPIDADHNQDKDFFGYIIVPFKKDHKLRYYLGRDYIGNYLRYKNPAVTDVSVGKSEVIYNEEALYFAEVFIMEGWSDAATIGKKGTATLGWSLSRVQMDKYFKSGAKKLVFIPDAGIEDATGVSYYQKAVQAASLFLETNKQVYVVDLNAPEFDSFVDEKGKRAKDVNAIGRKEVLYKYKHDTAPLTWGSAMEIITA